MEKQARSQNLLIHPGETIAGILKERGISQMELAILTGVTPAYISKVIHGKKDISSKFALALEYVFGADKSFWLKLQADYDAALLETKKLETVTEQELTARTHLNEIVKQLREQNIIPPAENEKESILSLRSALKLSNLSNLPLIARSCAIRMCENKEYDPFVLGARIRMCQSIGDQREIHSLFEKNRIPEMMEQLKQLIADHREIRCEELSYFMEGYGIDFSVIPPMEGAPANGYFSRKKEGTYQITVTFMDEDLDGILQNMIHALDDIVNEKVDRSGIFVDGDIYNRKGE